MADAPQVVYDHAPIPYTRQDEHIDSKEKMYHAVNGAIDESNLQEERPDSPQRTVLGIRRRNFWILVVGLLIIVAATIGGSVGGALAVRNDKSSTQDQSNLFPPATSGSATSSLSPAAPTISSPASTIIAPNPRTVANINVTCPSTLKDFMNKDFDCTNDVTLEGGEPDITGMIAYNLQQCIDACSTYNELAKNATCVGVVLVSTMAQEYATNHGANCWLKRWGNDEKGTFGNTAARRRT